MTVQRTILYKILNETKEHMTAQTLYERAKLFLPTISLGTVYRNLMLMEKEKQIKRVPMPDKADLFEAKTVPHHHLLCVNCGTIRDLQIPGLNEAIAYQTGEKIQGCDLLIYTTCPMCEDKNKKR